MHILLVDPSCRNTAQRLLVRGHAAQFKKEEICASAEGQDAAQGNTGNGRAGLFGRGQQEKNKSHTASSCFCPSSEVVSEVISLLATSQSSPQQLM